MPTQHQIASSLVVTPLDSCLAILLCVNPQTETTIVAYSHYSTIDDTVLYNVSITFMLHDAFDFLENDLV